MAEQCWMLRRRVSFLTLVRFARGALQHVHFSSRRSAVVSSSPLTGSLPCSAMYASISRFSNTVPDFAEATGFVGASPDTKHRALVRICVLGRRRDGERTGAKHCGYTGSGVGG